MAWMRCSSVLRTIRRICTKRLSSLVCILLLHMLFWWYLIAVFVKVNKEDALNLFGKHPVIWLVHSYKNGRIVHLCEKISVFHWVVMLSIKWLCIYTQYACKFCSKAYHECSEILLYKNVNYHVCYGTQCLKNVKKNREICFLFALTGQQQNYADRNPKHEAAYDVHNGVVSNSPFQLVFFLQFCTFCQ